MTNQQRTSRLRRTFRIAEGPAAGALSKPEIAGLTVECVRKMGVADLVRVVHAARLPCLDGSTLGRLHLFDRQTLERIVFLARRTCRNQGY